MFSKIFLGLALTTASIGNIYSMDPGVARAVPVAPMHGFTWRDMFPGVEPAPVPGPDYVIDNIIQNMQNPEWNGVINTWNGPHLSNLSEVQLNQLMQRIRETLLAPGQISFTAPFIVYQNVWQGVVYQHLGVRLNRFALPIEIPFHQMELIEQIRRSEFPGMIMSGAPRKTMVARGVSLGKAWATLKDFIDYYKIALNQVELLLASADLAPAERVELEKLIEPAAALLNRLSEVYIQINTEFEKPAEERNMEVLEKALREFMPLLCGEQMHRFLQRSVFDIMRFAANQAPLAKLKILFAFRNAATRPAAVAPKTTADMLDKLLTVPGRAKAIADAIAEVGPGWAPPTLRLDSKLWNVFKLDDPEAAAIQQYLEQQRLGHQNWQFQADVIRPLEARASQMVKSLNLKVGPMSLLIRIPAADRHVFKVVRFNIVNVPYDGQGPHAVFDSQVGVIEVREAKDGDRTGLYNPSFRVHGPNSIGGTMMEQRVHEVMAEHRVHNFSKLPEAVQHGLRVEIDRYSDERNQTRYEGQGGLASEMLTREERALASGASEADAKRLGAIRAAKVSSELKKRLIDTRIAQLRAQGDDLTGNPAELMQSRVHALFDSNRLHAVRGLTQREQQFFGENLEGGFVDTVESAIAERQAPFDPRRGPERIHFDAARVHHQKTHQTAPYNVVSASAMAAPAPAYESVASALADYEMQRKLHAPGAYEASAPVSASAASASAASSSKTKKSAPVSASAASAAVPAPVSASAARPRWDSKPKKSD